MIKRRLNVGPPTTDQRNLGEKNGENLLGENIFGENLLGEKKWRTAKMVKNFG